MTTEPRALSIRPMRADDIQPLADALGWPTGGIRARWDLVQHGDRQIFVAEYDGCIAGRVSFNIRRDVPDQLHLFELDVSPDMQRRGIGTALVAAVEDEATRRGMRRVWLDVGVENVDARRLYERLDYRTEGDLVRLSYSAPNADGSWRDVDEVCHRMFHTLDGAS